MASGKKNYFRHSFHARKHSDIAGLIEDHGKEAYFHFFALVELCAEQASDSFPEDSRFTFRRSTVCRELLVTNSRLSRHLLVTVPSLVDDIVVTENSVEILFPKLAKYMGKYETKSTSKTPNKEIKEIKKETLALNAPVIFTPKKQPPKKPKPIFFEVEPMQIEEEQVEETAVKILTALNSICFKSFRPTKFNLGFINARLNDGYEYEDFLKVIKFKHEEWSHDPKMSAYVQPSTLFNGKMDQYIQQAQNALKPKIDPLDAFLAQYEQTFSAEA